MTFYKSVTSAILLYIICNNTSFSTPMFPRGCEITGFGFSQNDLVLNERNHQAFFLMQNRANFTIELRHIETRPNVFMSPSLATKIASGHWAAFASDVSNLYFRCYKNMGSERMAINCRDALDICQYPRVKFALSNMGTYWASTDKPLQQVIQDATKKGIYLHW